MNTLNDAVTALEKFQKYTAYNGAVTVDGKNLYLFGELCAVNLREHIAINLCGERQFAHQLNNLPGIQIEKYGDSLFLNGDILPIDDRWLIVNKKYGNWRAEEELCWDYDFDYSQFIDRQNNY